MFVSKLSYRFISSSISSSLSYLFVSNFYINPEACGMSGVPLLHGLQSSRHANFSIPGVNPVLQCLNQQQPRQQQQQRRNIAQTRRGRRFT